MQPSNTQKFSLAEAHKKAIQDSKEPEPVVGLEVAADEVPLEKRIFILTPIMEGKVWVSFMQGFMEFEKQASKKGYLIAWAWGSGNGVARIRNRLTAQFAQNDFGILLNIDSDLPFKGKHIWRLLESYELLYKRHGGLVNVSGMYPIKTHVSPRWVFDAMIGSSVEPDTGLLPCRDAATGLKLISREAIYKLLRENPEREYVDDAVALRTAVWDVFAMGVVNGRYLSEDYYFDHLCIKHGIPVYLDTQVAVRHEGVAVFPLEPLAIPGRPGWYYNPDKDCIEEMVEVPSTKLVSKSK